MQAQQLHSCQHGRAAAFSLIPQSCGSLVAKAMPFRVPNAGQISRILNPLQLLPEQPPKLSNLPSKSPSPAEDPSPAEGSTYSTQMVQLQQQQPSADAAGPFQCPGISSPGSSLKFAKHLAIVSNGCAPPMSRFESLGWLLFESKRLQASLVGPQQHVVGSWVSSRDSMQLLEQVYLVGAAIAELGTADGLQPLSSSNGSRAIVSLDYSRLLERYLQQHGHLLAEEFWSQLHAYDDLQARAIHVATALETRCMVHAMLFDKLIERVGTEPGAAAAAWGGGSWSAQSSAPLATAITNTMINTTQQHSAPVTTQSTVAAPSAVNSNSGNNSNVASSAGSQSTVHGIWGWLGQVGAVFLLLCIAAGKVVQVVIAVVSFAKDVVMQLLMLRAVHAGAKAVAARATEGSQLQLQPVYAAAGALPTADASQTRQLPGAVAGPSLETLQPVQAAAQPSLAAAVGAAPTVAAFGAAAFDAHGSAQQLHANGLQLQQQQQQDQQAALGHVIHAASRAQPFVADAVQQQAPQQLQQESLAQQQSQAAASLAAIEQQQKLSPQQRLRGGLRSGLQGGLGVAQHVLHRAAAKVTSTAASIPGVLQQQQQKGSKSFKAGSGHLLYSLWSPVEAGLQDMELEAAAGVQFADAGWGSAGGGTGAAVRSAEEGW